MKNVKVSVIVPVYNVEKYLEKCLNSLVGQTLSDIEILVVNDGSPDNSQAIIDDFAARHPDKIRPFIKENGGLSDARNFGIARAEGEYIAFVDSDDYVDMDMYERMYQEAAECDADVVCCPFTLVADGEIIPQQFGDGVSHFGKSVADSPQILRQVNSYAWNKLYRRDFWNKNGFRFPIGRLFEDSALIYNVMGAANRVACVDTPFYHYLFSRADSITNAVDERVFDILRSVADVVEYYKTLPQTPALQDEVTYLCLRHTMARIYKLDRVSDKRLARRFVDACYDFYEANLPDWRKSSYVCPPKNAGIRTKVRCFVKRHRVLTRWLYTGRLIKSLGKGMLNLTR